MLIYRISTSSVPSETILILTLHYADCTTVQAQPLEPPLVRVEVVVVSVTVAASSERATVSIVAAPDGGAEASRRAQGAHDGAHSGGVGRIFV